MASGLGKKLYLCRLKSYIHHIHITYGKPIAYDKHIGCDKKMSDIKEIQNTLDKFNKERDWDQFHDGKNLALALSIEAAELNEAFLWKSAEEADIEKIKEELADVMNYGFMLADRYHIDIKEICLDKIKKNAEKYPVNKAKGSAKKYNEL